MLGFGTFCLDFGHIAWIWAIWQNFGQNRPQRNQSPEDGVGGMEVRMDGQMDKQIPPVFYRTSIPSGLLPNKRKKPKGGAGGSGVESKKGGGVALYVDKNIDSNADAWSWRL